MPKKRILKAGHRPVKAKPWWQNRSVGIAGLVIILAVIVIVVLVTVLNQPPAQSAAAGTTPAANAAVPTAGGPTPVLIGTKTYKSAPPMLIDTKKQYTATVTMAKGGQFVIQLFADKAPITVNSFVFLARQGYFDGVTFHRVLPNFMAQGGDPTGTGGGGPGYQFAYEANDQKFDKAGVVAMANTGARTPTNGSQFFITFVPYPSLDGGYTIFGQVTSGMDVVNAIKLRDPNTNPTFQGDAIQTITISEN